MRLHRKLCGFSKTVLTVILFLISIEASLADENSDGAPALSIPQVRSAFSLINQSPYAVYRRFGKPVFADQNSFSGFGYVGEDRKTTLIHSYNIADGGRIGFLYVPIGGYRVAAIAFDNMNSTRFLTLRDIFSPNTLHVLKLLRACIQEDFYHTLPGDSYDWPGQDPNTTAVGVLTTEWATAKGGTFFTSFRLEKQYQDQYDPVSGTNQRMPHLDLRTAKLLTFFWNDSPGRSGVSDLRLGDHLGHVTTVVFSNPSTPCFTYVTNSSLLSH